MLNKLCLLLNLVFKTKPNRKKGKDKYLI